MLREPSGLRVQPSYAGWTLCPELNFNSLIAISWAPAEMIRPKTTTAAATMCMRFSIGIAESCALGQFRLVVGFFEVRPCHPRKAHFVDRALPVTPPVSRI